MLAFVASATVGFGKNLLCFALRVIVGMTAIITAAPEMHCLAPTSGVSCGPQLPIFSAAFLVFFLFSFVPFSVAYNASRIK